ncbi:hypothetical protein [Yersinia phage fHe-Yen9-03]|uniref:Uncharacterized protein n=1 Tax=Yersinia phage fHe-Yen9-03 TaxID=2052743 RepID=A0A2C9CZK6_9CAUD|nr:hypothetical protein [Yersinia phage fHe-Yen9-03]
MSEHASPQLINVSIKHGDVIDIEHTCVDRREHISVFVSHSTIHNGRGVAIFHDNDGKVYLWKPSDKCPHGIIERVDSPNKDFLVNPYVRIYCPDVDKFRPVDSFSGSYLITK